MREKPRATVREIWDYLLRLPHPTGDTQVEKINIPGYDKLVVKMIPTHETVDRESSREAGEKLFEILCSTLTIGIYEGLEKKMCVRIFQDYSVPELIEMREMTAVFENHSYRTKGLYRILNREIQSREE